MRKQYYFWPGSDGLDAWDVDHLIDLAAELPVIRVRVEDLPEIDSEYWYAYGTDRPTTRSLVEHMRLVLDADLSYPIILSAEGRVMDGMHRIARALLEGQDGVAAVQFPVTPSPDHRGCSPADLPY